MAMRNYVLSTMGGGFLLLAGIGFAMADTIIVTPEQETVIHDYVGTQHVDPYIPEDGVDISVGAALPDTVELHSIDVPDAQPVYSYVLVDGRTVLVDPTTRRIVKIIN
jgi:hypothetical protein